MDVSTIGCGAIGDVEREGVIAGWHVENSGGTSDRSVCPIQVKGARHLTDCAHFNETGNGVACGKRNDAGVDDDAAADGICACAPIV